VAAGNSCCFKKCGMIEAYGDFEMEFLIMQSLGEILEVSSLRLYFPYILVQPSYLAVSGMY